MNCDDCSIPLHAFKKIYCQVGLDVVASRRYISLTLSSLLCQIFLAFFFLLQSLSYILFLPIYNLFWLVRISGLLCQILVVVDFKSFHILVVVDFKSFHIVIKLGYEQFINLWDI